VVALEGKNVYHIPPGTEQYGTDAWH